MKTIFYKMIILSLLVIMASCGSSSVGDNADYYQEEAFSEARSENETWEEAEIDSESAFEMLDEEDLAEFSLAAGATAKNAHDSREAASLELSALNNVPAWSSSETITAAFTKLRDTAFISWTYNNASFPRRSTWLYPDDGCFARAEIMAFNLETWGYSGVAKIFVFGNLEVTSANAQKKSDGTTGTVKWWYHVAPILKSPNNENLVIDPSMGTNSPMPLADWLNSMGWNNGSGTSFLMSICPAHTYVPYDTCDFALPSTGNYSATLERQKNYLPKEWDRLVSLGRDPQRELGNYPPWLSIVADTVDSATSREDFSPNIAY